MLLLPPLLPCLRLHSPALIHVCQLLFTHPRLPAPVYPLSFTHSRSPFAPSCPPLSFSFTHPPSFVHHCPHPLVASLVTSPPSPFSSAPHACAPAIHGCTSSFVHVCLCRSGACFGRIVRLGSDGGPTRGLGGQGFDQSPETEHLMLGFARAV